MRRLLKLVGASTILTLLLAGCGGGSGSAGGSTSTGQDVPGATEPTANTTDCIDRVRAAAIEGSGRQIALLGSVTAVNDGNLLIGCAVVTVTASTTITVGANPGSLSDIHSGDVINLLATLNTESGVITAETIEVVGSGAATGIRMIRLGWNFAPTVRGTWLLFDGPEYAVLPAAKVSVDGTATGVQGLAINEGEIVWLSGALAFPTDSNPGGLLSADAVKITHIIDGPVDAVDVAHSQIVVLGQTVFQTDRTYTMSGGKLGPDTLKVGDRVVVAGHPTATGAIIATGIGFSTNSGDYFVSGVVHLVDASLRRFVLNGALVDYSIAALDALPNGIPVEGERVAVHATRATGTTTLIATSVEDDSALPGSAAGTLVSMHGVVTSVLSPTEVAVDGYPVTVAEAVQKSCEFAAIANADVTLDGKVASDGTVVASRICFYDGGWGGATVIQGPVASIDPASGALSVLGFSVQPDPTTRVQNADGTRLRIGDLAVGDSVSVRGGYGPLPGLIMADTIVRQRGPATAFIEARAGYITVADPMFYINGWPIATDSHTTFTGLTREQFFMGHSQWPHWDHICQPTVTVTVLMDAAGSLTATAVVERPDYC